MNGTKDSLRPADVRSVGLLGATGVGVGAIVGGGILVLVGAAFATTGPSAIIAFAVNGIIAFITAMSFAEMSTAFPQSGGAYTFAKKVLSVRAAFGVGWVLWFAYIVAAVLYARGFAEFGVVVMRDLWELGGARAPGWVSGRRAVLGLALLASASYALNLVRKAAGGGQWATVGKLVVFAILIVGGFWVLVQRPIAVVRRDLTPFFPYGTAGLLQAMGTTFIAVQGFDLVAAIAGEVKQPARTIPRAMFLSLGCALVVYLPLLVIVATVGTTPSVSITAMSLRNPETVMADAARNYLGTTGYWLVMVAAILSTLSALGASLLAASRVALTMARDRTLPRVLATVHPSRATPVMATYASFLAVVAILFMIPDLAAAGAAASLIFLVSFALAHWTAFLARRRSRNASAAETFRTPWFPAVPIVGGTSCAAMAVFQGVAVPAAGGIAAVWLGLGVMLYVALFAQRAEVVDAAAEGQDPELTRLRGRSPLVLVPVSNPHSAQALVTVASALTPPLVGRVLLLTVMMRSEPPDVQRTRASLVRSQEVLGEALQAALLGGHSPEALITAAPAPWEEIRRVARVHRCESLLVGLSQLDDIAEGHLEGLLNQVDCDVAVLRALPGWQLEAARKIVVPIGGRAAHDELRARLLGSLARAVSAEVHFVRVLAPDADESTFRDAERDLVRLAEEESQNTPVTHVIRSGDVTASVAALVEADDLVILGLQRQGKRKLFGRIALDIVRHTHSATILISRRS